MTLKELIYKGLYDGIVKITKNPHTNKIICEIGDYWFPFLDRDHKVLTPDEVYKFYTKEQIADFLYDSILLQVDDLERAYYTNFLIENIKNEFHYIGYLSLYIKIEDIKKECHYLKWESDFSKPVTEEVLKNLLDITKKSAKNMGIVPSTVSFVTKEEYDKFATGPTYTYEWDDRE